jgi:integrase/recombinase XerD
VSTIGASDRKGWHAALRDSVIFKTTYAWGLRNNEVRHLQAVDFARNPHAREFGRFGVLHVRFGKAMRGSAPKPRSVLTVFDWSGEIVQEWLDRGYDADGLDLFTTERGTLVSESTLLRRFRRYCEDLSLPSGLDLHSLRRSYATHLIESGMDPLFVQLLLSLRKGVYDVQHAGTGSRDLRGGSGYLPLSITQTSRRFDACATGADSRLIA